MTGEGKDSMQWSPCTMRILEFGEDLLGEEEHTQIVRSWLWRSSSSDNLVHTSGSSCLLSALTTNIPPY